MKGKQAGDSSAKKYTNNKVRSFVAGKSVVHKIHSMLTSKTVGIWCILLIFNFLATSLILVYFFALPSLLTFHFLNWFLYLLLLLFCTLNFSKLHCCMATASGPLVIASMVIPYLGSFVIGQSLYITVHVWGSLTNIAIERLCVPGQGAVGMVMTLSSARIWAYTVCVNMAWVSYVYMNRATTANAKKSSKSTWCFDKTKVSQT